MTWETEGPEDPLFEDRKVNLDHLDFLVSTFLSLYDYHHAQLHITKVKQPKNKIIKPTLLNLIY